MRIERLNWVARDDLLREDVTDSLRCWRDSSLPSKLGRKGGSYLNLPRYHNLSYPCSRKIRNHFGTTLLLYRIIQHCHRATRFHHSTIQFLFHRTQFHPWWMKARRQGSLMGASALRSDSSCTYLAQYLLTRSSQCTVSGDEPLHLFSSSWESHTPSFTP